MRASARCETFVAQQLIQTEDGCELTASANVWYYEPWEEKPNTSDWWQMDQKKRSLKIPRTLTTKVTVHEHEDGLEITLHTEGLEKLPLSSAALHPGRNCFTKRCILVKDRSRTGYDCSKR